MDIRKLAENAMDLASRIAPQAKKTVVVRHTPSKLAYDPVEETPGATTWGFSESVEFFNYSRSKRNEKGEETEYDTYFVKKSLLGSIEPDTRAEIVINAIARPVKIIEIDPVGATVTLMVER